MLEGQETDIGAFVDRVEDVKDDTAKEEKTWGKRQLFMLEGSGRPLHQQLL